MKTGYRCQCGGVAVLYESRIIRGIKDQIFHRAKCETCGEPMKVYHDIENSVIVFHAAWMHKIEKDPPPVKIKS